MVVRISSQPSSGSFGSGLVPPLVCLSVYCLSGVSHELVHSSKYCVARRVCSSLRSFLKVAFFLLASCLFSFTTRVQIWVLVQMTALKSQLNVNCTTDCPCHTSSKLH